MAVSSNSLTLQQYAEESNSPLIQRIVYSLLDVHSILNDISFQTVPSMKVNGSRIVNSLPTPNWRKINGSSVTASTTASPFQEQVYILSNNIDMDRLFTVDQNSVGDPRAVQANGMLKSWSYDITDKFINNNHNSGNSDSIVGIRQRLDSPTTWGIDTNCKIDASGVDLSNSGITASTANTFVRYVDQLLDAQGDPDGTGTVIYMNRDLRRRFANAVRLMGAGGGFDMSQDAFGRRVMMYRNAVVRSLGVKGDQTTEIITSTETSAGANGSSNYTSMYAVKYGDDTFNGWQMEPLRVENIGLRPDEPTSYRIFLEWALGLYQQNTRSLARVYDIKVS
jgi:hypothetical protein